MRHIGLVSLGLMWLAAAPSAPLAAAEPKPKTMAEFIAAVKHDNKHVRLKAIKDLGEMGEAAREGLPALTAALHDAEVDVRAQATRALGQIGRPAIPILIREMQEPEFTLRARAARALAAIGPEAAAAVPVLTASLKHAHADARAMSAYALGEIGPGAWKAAPALVGLLIDPEKDVRQQARSALVRIGADAAPALSTALKADKQSLRLQAAQPRPGRRSASVSCKKPTAPPARWPWPTPSRP